MSHRVLRVSGADVDDSAARDALDAAIAGAAARGGSVVVLDCADDAPILAHAAARSAGAGLDVLAARGVSHERDVAFGVASQLLGPALARLGPAERAAVLTGAARLAAPVLEGRDAGPAPASVLPAVHGLYWLASNLAERAPLALLVGDAHWADDASLRLCLYLAQRSDELPVALVVAARREEPGAPGALLDALAAVRT